MLIIFIRFIKRRVITQQQLTIMSLSFTQVSRRRGYPKKQLI